MALDIIWTKKGEERGRSCMMIQLEINHKKIIKIIREKGPISRIEISEIAQMTQPMITRITEDLIKENIILEVGSVPSSRGRRPMLLSFNHTCFYSIGVHLGRSIAKVALTDLNGNIIIIKQQKFRVDETIEVVIAFINQAIRGIIHESDLDPSLILGIGIGLPGPLDETEEGLDFPFVLFNERRINLRKMLKDEHNLPIVINNDSNVAAIAEKWFGKAIGYDNFIVVNSEVGVGSGIILNGNLYNGAHGHTGIIGHCTIDLDGELCSCGNYGCLESLVAIPKIEEKVRKRIKVSNASERRWFGDDIEKVTLTEIIYALEQGSRLAREILEEAGCYLGIGIANAINLLSPELVIIGGKFGMSSPVIVDSIKATVAMKALSSKGKRTPVVMSELHNGVVLGSSALMIDSIFSFYSIS